MLGQVGFYNYFLIKLAILVVIFLIIPRLFFKPFQKLIEMRHQRTVADRERAEELVRQANAKLEEFKTRMSAERHRARAEHERVIAEVKAEEAKIIATSREEAGKITRAASESIQSQSAALKRSLEADVEGMAIQISDMLTKR
jgi:F0F1-type ATP synthase membrane subunit b/b'